LLDTNAKVNGVERSILADYLHLLIKLGRCLKCELPWIGMLVELFRTQGCDRSFAPACWW
jgi:hypothetical protein